MLDSEEGIRYRGRTVRVFLLRDEPNSHGDIQIPECRAQLPKAPGGSEPLPEGHQVLRESLDTFSC